MRPETFIAGFADVDVSAIPDQESQCNICMVNFQGALTARPNTRYNLRSQALTTSADNASEKAVRLPCGHLLGRRCAQTWLTSSNTCPMCRALVIPLAPSPPVPSGDSVSEDLDYLMAYCHRLTRPEISVTMRIRARFTVVMHAGVDTPAWDSFWTELLNTHRRFLTHSPLTDSGTWGFWQSVIPQILEDDHVAAHVLATIFDRMEGFFLRELRLDQLPHGPWTLDVEV